MKTRLFFVSNSSSSSFITIRNIKTEEEINKLRKAYGNKPTFVVDQNRRFGWEYEVYNDFHSKLVFSYLQACQAGYCNREWLPNNVWMAMLEEILKENLNVQEIQWDIKIAWNDDDYSYIDHQSASYEGRNIEMFENKTILRNFLFSPSSSITTDNDNH